jgi:hypothetical protein
MKDGNMKAGVSRYYIIYLNVKPALGSGAA